MKKSTQKILSVILAVTLLFSGSMIAFAADEDRSSAGNAAMIAVTDGVNSVLNALFKGFGSLFPKDFPTVDEYYATEHENFYEGMDTFLDEPAEDARWNLGFGKASIVPENLADGSKTYYTGGYFTQKVNGVYDDQGANVIALNDNSGRGTVIMAAVDGIGINNGDIRSIRETAEKKLAKLGIESDIVAININGTHCHTVTDTQGFGLELIPKAFQNIFSPLPFITKTRSIDRDFLKKMIDGVSDAIVEAYVEMESGELYYFETAGIAKNDDRNAFPDDEYSYIFNKRYSGEGFQNFIACFKFVPDNKDSAPTIFSNLGAHPTTINRSTSLLSADFPHYIEEKINAQGMNFMFIQGAQSPVSVHKSAVETVDILMEIDAQIAADPIVNDYAASKKLGYEFARLIVEAQADAQAVAPVINVKMAEVTVPLEYGLMELGAVSGLLSTTTVIDETSPCGFSVISEIGYVELGTDIVILTVPGELVPQLVYGNVVDKTEAYLGTDWEIECTADIIGGDKTVLVMGLCNDALGYIVPDNDYAPFIADSLWNNDFGTKLFGRQHSHYEEMLATSSKTGSVVMTALNDLVKEVR